MSVARLALISRRWITGYTPLLAMLTAIFPLPFLAANAAESPLSLAKAGWLYVGGQVTTINNKSFMVGQMYAEFMIPAKKGSQTAAAH